MSKKPWIVLKFGGNSVADLSCWNTIATIAARNLKENKRPLIVCSALAGVTNQLEKLILASVAGEPEKILHEIETSYRQLAKNLNVDSVFEEDFNELTRLVTGITFLREASPMVRAKVLSMGEILLTRIGAAFLQKNLATTWCDARTLLKSLELPHDSIHSHYLAAKCVYHKEPELIEKMEKITTPVAITQGFIGSNIKGETVILGRGGSDTSAAYFAAKLGASRCEIWTDVLGIYTANPHEIPEAFLIKSLDYDEAQEIASMGAKVLHPYCIPPVKANAIPLYVGCTRKPDRQGTEINFDGRNRNTLIKSVITKYHVLLIQVETVQMWQQAGFLADVFACFKKHGLSIDLISTSETTVTVSLDLKIHEQNATIIDVLLEDLNTFCRAISIGPCAAISIVGHNIRSVLPHIGQALKIFEEQKIYLLSQAANDLNLTFVVDENQAARLAKKLHMLLIEENSHSPVFEKSWQEEFLPKQDQSLESPWWQKKSVELLNLANSNNPIYVYDQQVLKENANRVKQLKSIQQIFYAMKANGNVRISQTFEQMGIGFECVSIGELEQIEKLFPKINPQRILFTPNFAARHEYEAAIKKGYYITIDNLYPLIHWPELFSQQPIILRIDPGKGHGHHKHVCTAGENSKFGIPVSELPTSKELVKKIGAKVIGLHAHTGSGILESNVWPQTALFLLELCSQFPEISIINLGGGLGIPERPGQKSLDLKVLDAELSQITQLYPHIQFWLEPGRYLVASAGVLLAQVTQIKKKNEMTFIGVNTGMNSLIRPALYGAYHQIVNLTRLDQPNVLTANIVGPICETGDTLGFSRLMPETREGDILLIANAGAYGYSMSSHYNLRQPAEEVFLII